jgi:hypothetical protein
MKNEILIGDIQVNKVFVDIEIILLSVVYLKGYNNKHPLLIFINNEDDEIYFSINSYEFSFAEHYTDWVDSFNSVYPGINEVKYLSKIGIFKYYKLDYIKTMAGDLDEFSENELEILKSWNRESNLRKLLK